MPKKWFRICVIETFGLVPMIRASLHYIATFTFLIRSIHGLSSSSRASFELGCDSFIRGLPSRIWTWVILMACAPTWWHTTSQQNKEIWILRTLSYLLFLISDPDYRIAIFFWRNTYRISLAKISCYEGVSMLSNSSKTFTWPYPVWYMTCGLISIGSMVASWLILSLSWWHDIFMMWLHTIVSLTPSLNWWLMIYGWKSLSKSFLVV